MKTGILLFLKYLIIVKVIEAQLSLNQPGTPQYPVTGIQRNPSTIPNPSVISKSTSNIPVPERMPKCYPEKAKAYFIPAPPMAPIVTILDTKAKDLAPNLKATYKEITTGLPAIASSSVNQECLRPPPIAVSPDLIDEIPAIFQERCTRFAESDDEVCDACALVAKLPIYNFDQELLNGFLAGLGL